MKKYNSLLPQNIVITPILTSTLQCFFVIIRIFIDLVL